MAKMNKFKFETKYTTGSISPPPVHPSTAGKCMLYTNQGCQFHSQYKHSHGIGHKMLSLLVSFIIKVT